MNEGDLISDDDGDDSYVANQQRVSELTQEVRNQQALLQSDGNAVLPNT